MDNEVNDIEKLTCFSDPGIVSICVWCLNGSYDEIDYIEEIMNEDARIKAGKLGIKIRGRYYEPECGRCKRNRKRYDLKDVLDYIYTEQVEPENSKKLDEFIAKGHSKKFNESPDENKNVQVLNESPLRNELDIHASDDSIAKGHSKKLHESPDENKIVQVLNESPLRNELDIHASDDSNVKLVPNNKDEGIEVPHSYESSSSQFSTSENAFIAEKNSEEEMSFELFDPFSDVNRFQRDENSINGFHLEERFSSESIDSSQKKKFSDKDKQQFHLSILDKNLDIYNNDALQSLSGSNSFSENEVIEIIDSSGSKNQSNIVNINVDYALDKVGNCDKILHLQNSKKISSSESLITLKESENSDLFEKTNELTCYKNESPKTIYGNQIRREESNSENESPKTIIMNQQRKEENNIENKLPENIIMNQQRIKEINSENESPVILFGQKLVQFSLSILGQDFQFNTKIESDCNENKLEDNQNIFSNEENKIFGNESIISKNLINNQVKKHEPDLRVNKFLCTDDSKPFLAAVQESKSQNSVKSCETTPLNSEIKPPSPLICKNSAQNFDIEVKNMLKLAEKRAAERPFYSQTRFSPNYVKRFIIPGKVTIYKMDEIVAINDHKTCIIRDKLVKKGKNGTFQCNWIQLRDTVLTCYNGKLEDLTDSFKEDDGDLICPDDEKMYLTRKYSIDLKDYELHIMLNDDTNHKFLRCLNSRTHGKKTLDISDKIIKSVTMYGKEYKIVFKDGEIEKTSYIPFLEFCLVKDEEIYSYRVETINLFYKWILTIGLRQDKIKWPIS